MRIMTVHGVGNASPGSILGTLAQNAPTEYFTREDLVLSGHTYPRLRGPGGISEALEVNWSDLRLPRRSPFAVLKHLLWLVIAMLSVAVESFPPGPSKFALIIYRGMFEGYVFWSLLIPVQVMLLVTAKESFVRGLITGVIVAFTIWLTITLSSYSRWFAWGFLWAGVMALFGLMTILYSSQRTLDCATTMSAWVYLAAQVMVGVLLVLAALSLLISDLKWEQCFVYFALLYLPFALLSGVGALLWSASLLLPDKVPLFNPDYFKHWGELFTRSLRYDLRTVELAFTIAIASMGILGLLLGLLVAGFYYFHGKPSLWELARNALGLALVFMPVFLSVPWVAFRVSMAFWVSMGILVLLAVWVCCHRTESPGELARSALSLALKLMPVFLSVAGVVFAMSLFGLFGHPNRTTPGSEVLQIYATSALRLLPFLGFMVGPLAVTVDVIGDVLFFLAAEPLSIRNEAVSRVKAALHYLSQSPGKHDVVLCHSQGSVLVRQALAESPSQQRLRLITVGCPLDSLYRRFLGWEPPAATLNNITWVNGYRTGDYIGWRVKEALENKDLGRGGHVNYWGYAPTWELVWAGTALSNNRPAAPDMSGPRG